LEGDKQIGDKLQGDEVEKFKDIIHLFKLAEENIVEYEKEEEKLDIEYFTYN